MKKRRKMMIMKMRMTMVLVMTMTLTHIYQNSKSIIQNFYSFFTCTINFIMIFTASNRTQFPFELFNDTVTSGTVK